MATFVLYHRHAPADCRIAFAAWRGFDSPLRHRPALASCATGGHVVWWTVEADGRDGALAQLPDYVAARTEVFEVSGVLVP